MPNVIKFSSLSGHVVRGDRCLKDYGFRLSQAADSAEVSYAMALLPSFCVSAAFRFELVSMLGGTKINFFSCAHWLGQKPKHDATNKSITRGKYGHFNWHQMLLYSRLYQVTLC